MGIRDIKVKMRLRLDYVEKMQNKSEVFGLSRLWLQAVREKSRSKVSNLWRNDESRQRIKLISAFRNDHFRFVETIRSSFQNFLPFFGTFMHERVFLGVLFGVVSWMIGFWCLLLA